MVVVLLKIAIKSFVLKLKVLDKCCLIVSDFKYVGFALKLVHGDSKAAPVAGTTLRTTGSVPADSRQ